MARRFKNLAKPQNTRLAKDFSWLLKANEDCTPEECRWVAVTVFAHWLHEDRSYWRISEASDAQKRDWDRRIADFLRGLAALDTPVHFRYRGRPRGVTQRLQFAAFTGSEPVDSYLQRRYDDAYNPQVVLPELGINLRFGDDWTLYLVYRSQQSLLTVCALAARLQLYLLPVFSVGDLNQYDKLAEALQSKGLGAVRYQPVAEENR